MVVIFLRFLRSSLRRGTAKIVFHPRSPLIIAAQAA